MEGKVEYLAVNPPLQAVAVGVQEDTSVPDSAQPLTAAELFTPQEEAFLRDYTSHLHRVRALTAAGLLPTTTLTPDDTHTAIQQAGRLIAKAEQLPWPSLASAVGADKLYFISNLKRVCEDSQGHIAIKGLMLLARVLGLMTDKQQHNRQVALVFAQAQAPQAQERPADLPFTLRSGDYRAFDSENDRAK